MRVSRYWVKFEFFFTTPLNTHYCFPYWIFHSFTPQLRNKHQSHCCLSTLTANYTNSYLATNLTKQNAILKHFIYTQKRQYVIKSTINNEKLLMVQENAWLTVMSGSSLTQRWTKSKLVLWWVKLKIISAKSLGRDFSQQNASKTVYLALRLTVETYYELHSLVKTDQRSSERRIK